MLQGAAFALFLAAARQSVAAPPAETVSPEQASRLPGYNDELFGFSVDGKNTLLLKQRSRRGDLQIDYRPMSAADVVPLICAADGPCPGIAYPDPLLGDGNNRVRTHSAGLAGIRRHETSKFLTTDYRITGSMFDKEHWEKMEKRP